MKAGSPKELGLCCTAWLQLLQEQMLADLAWDRTCALEMLSREVMLLDTFVYSGPCLSPVLLLLELQDPNPLKLAALNGKSTEGREQATLLLYQHQKQMTW